eukprot:TRINITY_DN19131_c0_g1_i1.p1 TRINITY_DN19131_c0_g1~~TRINITY_DN19131_c0_g1_i1.p1  ORF type:complete len:162 (-),score=28.78 TRINITY_DN19131_c0_g1_i1:386-871(-)
MGGSKGGGGVGCEWNQEIQIGTDASTRPIYGSVWCCGESGPFAGNGGSSASDGSSKRVLIGTIEIIPSAIMAASGSGKAPAPVRTSDGQMQYRTSLPIILPPISNSSGGDGGSGGSNPLSAGMNRLGSFMKAKTGNKVASGSEGQVEAGHMNIGLVFNRMA